MRRVCAGCGAPGPALQGNRAETAGEPGTNGAPAAWSPHARDATFASCASRFIAARRAMKPLHRSYALA